MSIIRISKEFDFEAAHALWNYNGLCKSIHGHSYKLFVTIIGEPISDKKNPKYGMLMDFGDIKKIINEEVISEFDHSLIVFKEALSDSIQLTGEMYSRLILTAYQPTCENMTIDFANRIKEVLPNNVKLFSLKLFETATSYAEWFASDN